MSLQDEAESWESGLFDDGSLEQVMSWRLFPYFNPNRALVHMICVTASLDMTI